MLSTIAESYPLLLYCAPPLIGAFIGYLTNRVAIRMLFRPLRAWYVGPLRIPMTPGVIPSKRHELAENIGEMVGEHLVTGDEINRALQKDDFQEHLRVLIETRTASLLKKDCGSLSSIIPESYRVYFDIGLKTISYRVKETIHSNILAEDNRELINHLADAAIDRILSTKLDEMLSVDERQKFIEHLARTLHETLQTEQAEQQLSYLIETEIGQIVQSGKSCRDVLPNELSDAIVETIRNQTEFVLDQAVRLVDDPEIRNRIVVAVLSAIDEFIDTLGPMSSMARNFLNADLVEDKVRLYLEERRDDIQSFFHDEAIGIRVRAALGERIESLLDTPLVDLAAGQAGEAVPAISQGLAGRVIGLFKKPEAKDVIAGILETLIGDRPGEGRQSIGSIMERLAGRDGVDSARNRVREAAFKTVNSPEFYRLIDRNIDELFSQVVNRPIGRLDHLIPPGVIDGVCRSLREVTTRVLIAEVPSVIALIRIRKMVSDKIDSFDLLRLEKLLLSIMQEQFKYINLFGALLGFIIGCANLLFILGG